MSERSKFIKGTVILIIANACAKILGAVFKIPLTYILEEEGMAVYNTAFSVYIMMLSLATGGFPFAATKLLAEYTAKGRNDRIRPVVRSVGIILFILGAAGSTIMYLFSNQLAVLMREPDAAGAIRAVSMSVILVAAGAVIKSSNEARAEFLPTAFSQVFEAAVKLFCGFYLAAKLIYISPFKAAEGAIFGVTIGEASATALLIIAWRFCVRNLPTGKADRCELKAIFSVAIPLLLTSAATGLLGMAEVTTIRSSLSKIQFSPSDAESFLLKYSSYTNVFDSLAKELTLTQDGVRKLYGAFSGYAQTVFNLPVGIIATVSAAATPMFASALNTGGKKIQRATERVLALILSLAVPAAAVCLFFSTELLQLLFGNSFSADMLSSLAPSLIFLCTSNMLIAMLHLSGRILEPFLAVTAGLITKIILSAILIRIPQLNIIGAGIAGNISSAITFIFLSVVYRKSFGSFSNILRLLAVPVSASCIMVGIIKPMNAVLAVHTDCRIAFTASCMLGAAGYLLATLLLQRKSDITLSLGK